MLSTANDKISGTYLGGRDFNGPPSFILDHLRQVLDNAHPGGKSFWGNKGVRLHRWGGEWLETSLTFHTRAELEEFLVADKTSGSYLDGGDFNGPSYFILDHLRKVLDNAHPAGNPYWGHDGVLIRARGGGSQTFHTRTEFEKFLSA